MPNISTLAEMREFLDASNTLSFAGTGRKQIYALLERVLRTQKYLGLAKKRQRNRAPLSGQDQRTQQSANHPFDRPPGASAA